MLICVCYVCMYVLCVPTLGAVQESSRNTEQTDAAEIQDFDSTSSRLEH